MSDKYKIDSHKLIYHPKIVSQLLEVDGSWEKAKQIFPIYMEISPVGACNHRCTFCAVDYIGYQQRTIDSGLLISRLSEMGELGVKSIMYAGEGEPLLHKNIVAIGEATHNAGIDISFTSNATVIPKGFKERVLPICAWFKASFNAGTEETYAAIHQTKKSDFNRVLLNLQEMVEYRNREKLSCTIGVQMLLLPENQYEVHALAKICSEDLGVDYLVVKPYSQHLFSETKAYSGFNYEGMLEMEHELSRFNSNKFKIVFRSEAMKSGGELESERYSKCNATPYLWSYVMSDGAVYSCSAFLLDERFRLGNLYEQCFKSIWQSERRKKNIEFMDNDLDISECRKNCRMDSVNRYLYDLKNNNILHKNFI